MTADEAAALQRAGLRFLRLGAGRSPAGHQLGPGHGRGRAARRRDPGAVNRRANRQPGHADRRVDHHPLRHLHRRSGDRPGSSSATRSARVPPQWSVAYRFMIAAVAMALVAKWKGQSLRLDRGGLVAALVLGVTPVQRQLQQRLCGRAVHHVRRGGDRLRAAADPQQPARLGLPRPEAQRAASSSAGLVAMCRRRACCSSHELRISPLSGRDIAIGLASPSPACSAPRRPTSTRREGGPAPPAAGAARPGRWRSARCSTPALPSPSPARRWSSRGRLLARACSTSRCSARCSASPSISRWCARSARARPPIRA